MLSCQLPRSWVRTASPQGLGAASSSPGSCHSRDIAAVFFTCLTTISLTLWAPLAGFCFMCYRSFQSASLPHHLLMRMMAFMTATAEGPFPLFSEPVRRDTEAGQRPESPLLHRGETRDNRDADSLSFLPDKTTQF